MDQKTNEKVLLVGAGYVGRYLYEHMQNCGFELTVCDSDNLHLSGITKSIHSAYQELSEEFVSEFDVILWFAGHSSVPVSNQDPQGALSNNCLDLYDFARKKRDDTKFIYASTASMYSVSQIKKSLVPPALSEEQVTLNPVNPYDGSKLAFDAIASCFLTNTLGLRMGTVSGMSPCLRPELIFNAMNITAIKEKKVKVANSFASRSILFLRDLANVVCELMTQPKLTFPVLNVASANVTVGELGALIADYHSVPIEILPDSKTYSFQMDCQKMHLLMGNYEVGNILEQCDHFTKRYLEQL